MKRSYSWATLFLFLLLTSGLIAQVPFTTIQYRVNGQSGDSLATDPRIQFPPAGSALGNNIILREATTSSATNQPRFQLWNPMKQTGEHGISRGTTWEFEFNAGSVNSNRTSATISDLRAVEWDTFETDAHDIIGIETEVDTVMGVPTTTYRLNNIIGRTTSGGDAWQLLPTFLPPTYESSTAINSWDLIKFRTFSPSYAFPQDCNMWAVSQGTFVTLGAGRADNQASSSPYPSSTTIPSSSGTSSTEWLRFADIDSALSGGDDEPELILVISGNIHVLMNPDEVALGTGTANWVTLGSFPLSWNTAINPQLIDFDADSYPDFVGITTAGYVEIYEVQGDSSGGATAMNFSNSTTPHWTNSLGALTGLTDFVLADVDSNGYFDIVSIEGGSVRIRENTGINSAIQAFLTPYSISPSGVSIDSMGLADLDSDSNVDIVMTAAANKSLFYVCFQDSGQTSPYPGSPSGFAQRTSTPGMDAGARSGGPLHRVKQIRPGDTFSVGMDPIDTNIDGLGNWYYYIFIEGYPASESWTSIIPANPADPTNLPYAYLSSTTYSTSTYSNIMWGGVGTETVWTTTLPSSLVASGDSILIQAVVTDFTTNHFGELHEFQVE